MAINQQKRAIGVFPDRQDAEQALHELRDSGFPMNRVSVVARDADRNDEIAGADVSKRVGNKADEGAVAGALTGGTVGGITGLLVGLGALAIPGIGPVMLAGATATAIATTLSGGAIGAAAGSLAGALIGLGIPEERAKVYNERVAQGEYLVIVDGTDDEISRAEAILNRRGIQEFGIYDGPNVVTAPTDVATVTPEDTTSTIVQTEGTMPTPSQTFAGMRFGRNRHAVGQFAHRSDVEQAINDLRNGGFLLSLVSLIAPQFERQDYFTGVNLYGRFNDLKSGFPEERARFYNDRVSQGDYVLVVSGTEDEINRAASILSNGGIQEWQSY